MRGNVSISIAESFIGSVSVLNEDGGKDSVSIIVSTKNDRKSLYLNEEELKAYIEIAQMALATLEEHRAKKEGKIPCSYCDACGVAYGDICPDCQGEKYLHPEELKEG